MENTKIIERKANTKIRIFIMIISISIIILGSQFTMQLASIERELQLNRLYNKAIFIRLDEINNFLNNLEIRIVPEEPKEYNKDNKDNKDKNHTKSVKV